ncbi:MAG: bifunctional adenosylcobinamide kinase/adenosylcobinamide-phosphate guanylyltransferase [Thermodesulfovibrionales bacterium]
MSRKKIIFITGGARSGKSRFALQLSNKIFPMRKAYIATAEALDKEMEERIKKHRRERGDGWVTYEEAIKIDEVLKDIDGKYDVIIIDCLTIWLSNLRKARLDIEAEIGKLISSLVTPHQSQIYIISNEVGMGIVPENKIGRRFRDISGILNQKIAKVADEVYLMVAGLPVKIK